MDERLADYWVGCHCASKDVGVRKFLEGKGRAARILRDGWVDGWIACSLSSMCVVCLWCVLVCDDEARGYFSCSTLVSVFVLGL